jgi:precorrin-6Y C5,15-methyltransferase (decarboxylating)
MKQPVAAWLAIVGIGEDGIEGLSASARALIEGAALVVGGRRHLALAAPLIHGERMTWSSPLTDAIPAIAARRGTPVAVLASGDPYCYGIGRTLRSVAAAEETICVPAPSAFSLACARLGWAMQEVVTLSFCGRPLEVIRPHLQPGARILALSADASTPAAIAGLLREDGFGPSILHILEALGGPDERRRATTADCGPPGDLHALNLVGIEAIAGPAARIIPLACGLSDSLFEHDGQLTKQEIRAVTLAALAPRAGELLWDIGCGSGSIAIEWMLRHSANRAVAIEARPDRAARAGRNALALGVPGLQIVVGEAPSCLAGLPPPDAIFIGGGASDAGMLEACWAALLPGRRIVVNAVTIETEIRLVGAQAGHGCTLTRISIDRLDGLGGMHAFRPALRVTQWVAIKP